MIDPRERLRSFIGSDSEPERFEIAEKLEDRRADLVKTYAAMDRTVKAVNDAVEDLHEETPERNLLKLGDRYREIRGILGEAQKSVRNFSNISEDLREGSVDKEELDTAFNSVHERLGEFSEQRAVLKDEAGETYEELAEKINTGLEIVDRQSSYDSSMLDTGIDWENISSQKQRVSEKTQPLAETLAAVDKEYAEIKEMDPEEYADMEEEVEDLEQEHEERIETLHDALRATEEAEAYLDVLERGLSTSEYALETLEKASGALGLLYEKTDSGD